MLNSKLLRIVKSSCKFLTIVMEQFESLNRSVKRNYRECLFSFLNFFCRIIALLTRCNSNNNNYERLTDNFLKNYKVLDLSDS